MQEQKVLEKELAAQLEQKKRTDALLLGLHDTWFANKEPTYQAIASNVLQHCFALRFLKSPTDALFVVKLLLWLHTHDTFEFPTVLVLERVRLNPICQTRTLTL